MKWKKKLNVWLMGGLAIFFAFVSVAAAPNATTLQRDIPPFNPKNFVKGIDNPYFPLKPGTTFVYRGESEGSPTRGVMTVTNQTKKILGVTTIVVHDVAYDDGILVEDTLDWFAQDKDGNVWYFGENTKELDEDGNVISTEGSWEAGVDGAKPGVLMWANPRKGDRYQIEFYPDVAEDMAQVLGYKDSFCVKYGCFENVLWTKEWTPLEPGIVEHKYYAKGIGLIFTIKVKGEEEQTELVRLRRGG